MSKPFDVTTLNASCEPSGENATPWTIFLVVLRRTSSASVFASMTLTLWSFLLVTTTIAPSGEGSTL